MWRLLFLSWFAAMATRADTIYVASFNGGYIEKFATNRAGSTFATSVSAPEQMIFDRAGNLYLANYGNSTVLKFDTNGTVSVFCSTSGGANGLAFDSASNLYVANFDGGTIDKFSPTGNYLGQIVSGLNHPIVLAFDHDGNLLVSSYDNVLEKYSPDGTDLGAAITGLNGPTGIALDAAGNVYVSSFYGNTVDEYSATNGIYLRTVDNTANEPYYISFDSAGNLFVPNFGNGTVQEIAPDGTVSNFAAIDSPSSLAVWPGLPIGSETNILGSAATSLILKLSAPGQMVLQFIGSSNSTYTVLTSTNLFKPLTNWAILGAATLQASNVFQFTDAHATNRAQFYTVRSP